MIKGDKYKLRFKQDTFPDIPFSAEWVLVTLPTVNTHLDQEKGSLYVFALKVVVGENKYGYFDKFPAEDKALAAFNRMWRVAP